MATWINSGYHVQYVCNFYNNRVFKCLILMGYPHHQLSEGSKLYTSNFFLVYYARSAHAHGRGVAEFVHGALVICRWGLVAWPPLVSQATPFTKKRWKGLVCTVTRPFPPFFRARGVVCETGPPLHNSISKK